MSDNLHKTIAQCNKSLEFQPMTNWPEGLPAMTWGQYLLNGFDRDHGPTFDLQQMNSLNNCFLHAFKVCHPKLSFIQLASIYHQWSEQMFADLSIGFKDLVNTYDFRFSDSLMELIQKCSTLPTEFSFWAHDKDLSARDLSVLKSVPQLESLLPIFNLIANNNLSRSIGTQSLELAIELMLMGCENLIPPKVLEHNNQEQIGSLWLEHLRLQRFPNTSMSDEKQKMDVKKFPWPNSVDARWIRKGDEAGIEVKFIMKDAKELDKRLDGLRQVRTYLEKFNGPLND